MNIIVTGAAGFIGSHTTDLLLRKGHTVVGLDNLRTGRMANLESAIKSPLFRMERVDITKSNELRSIVDRFRPDAIIHLAALVSVQESLSDPALNRLLNVNATQCVKDSATTFHVPRLVFASSAAVYGNLKTLPIKETYNKSPLSPYGHAKLEGESILLRSQNNDETAICLRYFNVYGPRQDPKSPYSGVISIFHKCFTSGQPITIFGNGEQTRDFIHVSDVAIANVLAATVPNLRSSVLNVCSGKPTSLNQLLEVFSRSTEQSPEIKYTHPREGDIVHSLGDPALAKNCLGFTSKLELADGISAYLADQSK